MLEWYRLGFSLEDLMREVADLVRELLPRRTCRGVRELSRGGAAPRRFRSAGGATIAQLQGAARRPGPESPITRAQAGRDELLDLIVGAQGWARRWEQCSLTFLHRYPASQAALARLDADDPRVALRFELYHRGVELANGYHELASGAEQRQRFAGGSAVTRRARACRPSRSMRICCPRSMPACPIAPASRWVSIACSCWPWTPRASMTSWPFPWSAPE